MRSDGFDKATEAGELAEVFAGKRADLAARARGLGGLELMHAYSDLTDRLVARVFELAWSGVGDRTECNVAVAAVGGYGRREMSPFSDVDVAFIASSDDDEAADLAIKRAFRVLMEVCETAGVKVGYSYRRADEVSGLELETQTALLDARCVAGSQSLFSAFESALTASLVPAAFVTGHFQARTLNGWGDTPFVVEPDIKEGRGGLRDLHAARWIAQVTFGLAGSRVWEGLRSKGIIHDGDIADVREATEFISRTRNALHVVAGRGLDTLGVERHSEVAHELEIASESEFMSIYYHHAQALSSVLRRVGLACLEEPLAIEPGVVASGGKLKVIDRGLLARDETAWLRVFEYARSYSLDLDREAADLIRSHASDIRVTAETGRTFLDILSSKGVADALRSMADLGVLDAVVPQFGELMRLVPGDSAHQYTVGEHCLRTVQHLEALSSETNENLSEAFSRVQNLEVLALAALTHDLGKLDSTRDHSKTGAFRAHKIASAIGVSEDACHKVEFLVRNHLKMSETARLRDMSRQKTIKDFAAIVADRELLDMLFLLTIADSRSVGTKNWTQVQTRFLIELHERTSAALRSPDSGGADLERHRKRVRRELSLANLPMDEVDEHCESMPASYLLNTSPEDLAAHIGYVRTVREGQPVVEVKDDRAGDYTQLSVLATDHPGLLSEISGVLYALGIDIHASQIFTRHSSDDIAIDVLYIDFEGRQLSEVRKWQLEGDLASILAHEITVPDLLARWGKKPFEHPKGLSLKVLDNLSDHETVLEIRADDAPGLLHCLTRRIAEQNLNIHSARVSTWGHDARDVFYVTSAAGGKLSVDEVESVRRAVGDSESLKG